jgi:DNA (cytosine-5)-methyltransferase 1
MIKTHLGLFEGIGGFSLAARWMGWETLAWCEWNEFGQKVLKHHFPEAEGFGDITKTDFRKYANRIDILTGGFPCQPYSVAGKRRGKEDERHLWPEMLRAVREIQPTYVVGENVGGLVNWNGGMVFDEVQADLEAEGYEVQPFILPACAKNAPHRRDRVWFIAYSNSNRDNWRGSISDREKENKTFRSNLQFETSRFSVQQPFTNTASNGCKNGCKETIRKKQCSKQGGMFESKGMGGERDVTNTNSDQRCERRMYKNESESTERYISALGSWDSRETWANFPTQSPICGGDDGLPSKLDGITFPKWRNESIKAYGNAIVPQVAFEIFKAIEKIDNII